MDFKKQRMMIDKALDRYLPRADIAPSSLYKAMRYSVFSGGKRIRPAIVLESAKACGAPPARALPAACAVELVHTYSLVHDDLPSMDDDDYRRGKKTCHKKFGEATAILAGDGLLTLAFEIVARHMKPAPAALAIAELSDAIGAYGMVAGQALDIELCGKAKSSSLQNRINALKTARLFEACARLGAISAGARAARSRAMNAYGRHFGMAFQAVDDILDDEDYTRGAHNSKARALATSLAEKAKRALNIFGKEADGLRDIADLTLARMR